MPDRTSAAGVTRLEVVAAIQDAFDGGRYATSREVVRIATRSGARDEVLDLLARLPNRMLSSPGEVWNHFPEVPIGD